MPVGVTLSIPATDGSSGHATTQTSLFVHIPAAPSVGTTIFDYDLATGDYFRLFLTTARHLVLEFKKAGYGIASADGGAIPAATWVWASCGFSTAGGLHIRLDVTPFGGATTTVSALASSGSAVGITQTGIPFGVGVTITSVYNNFSNDATGGWLCSKLVVSQIAANTAAGNPEPVPTVDLLTGSYTLAYLAHDPLGSALLLTDSGTAANDLGAGPQGLTIADDGPALLPSSPGPGGAHEGDLSIYQGGQWTTLHAGTSGQELTVQSGYPAWTTDAGETVQEAGSTVGQHPIINFTSGATVTDDVANGRINVAIAGSGGTVTSISFVAPATFTVTGSPVSSTGTITLAWATQSANSILAGPAGGSAAEPTFRALVPADLPVSTATTLGVVKPGTGLSVAGDGTLSLVPGAALPAGAEGDVLIYRSGTWLGLAPSSDGDVLTMMAGYPTWSHQTEPLIDSTGAFVTDSSGNLIMA